jgi:hypothetical protein
MDGVVAARIIWYCVVVCFITTRCNFCNQTQINMDGHHVGQLDPGHPLLRGQGPPPLPEGEELRELTEEERIARVGGCLWKGEDGSPDTQAVGSSVAICKLLAKVTADKLKEVCALHAPCECLPVRNCVVVPLTP